MAIEVAVRILSSLARHGKAVKSFCPGYNGGFQLKADGRRRDCRYMRIALINITVLAPGYISTGYWHQN